MEYSTNSQLKYLAKPILILVAIISLLVFTVIFGIGKIKTLNVKIQAARVLKGQLTQKVDILQDVRGKVEEGVDLAAIALPSKGSILFGLSQIKNKVNSLGLTIENLKTTNVIKEEGGVERASISFDIVGDETNLYLFLDSFKKILPLSNINKLSITSEGGTSTAAITVNFYSSEAIEKIPAITGQVSGLTNEELDILNSLSSYEVPEFTIPTVSEFPVRDDIFN